MISLFARPSYLGNVYPSHTKELNTHRLSSRIRGEEMAERAGFKLNPRRGYENDVCIWVKPTGFGHIKDGDYVDVLDGLRKSRHKMLKDRPGINVIAVSENSYDTLKAELPNKIVLIPHHHINFKRVKRPTSEIDTFGYIGSPSPTASRTYNEIGEELSKLGFNFKTVFNYKTRQDAIDLYMGIDVMVIAPWEDTNPHKIPTKIINAASFGVPTIAYPLAGYKEIEGYYVRANSMDELLAEAQKFRDKDYYNEWSNKVALMAEKYHIDNIIRLYKKLE